MFTFELACVLINGPRSTESDTGMAFGSQLATIIGGLVPMFATALFPVYGTWPVSALVVASVIISCISLYSISGKTAAPVGAAVPTEA
jgi:hypothetical protein